MKAMVDIKNATTSIVAVMLLVSMFCSSCKDWLNVEAEDGIVASSYWQNKEDLASAVFGCYSAMVNPTLTQQFFLYGELRGGLVTTTSSTPINYSNIINGNILSDNAVCKWSSFYSVINSCNQVLYYAPIVKDLDVSLTDTLKKQYMAEALGIRSLMYFYLLRTFGDVPLVTVPTLNNNTSLSIAKSSKGEVLRKIINDLDTAIRVYGAPDTYNNDAYDKGRFTKYSLLALQADVYLWAEQYDNCIKSCDKIINSGRYALTARDTNFYYPGWFNKTFVVGNSYNESIFELQTSSSVLSGLSVVSPWYTLFSKNQILASSNMIELFPNQGDSLPDIRSNYAAYNYSSNKIWKYIGSGSGPSIEKGSTDYTHWFFYRYSDVMLMKAEAEVQLGGDGRFSIARKLVSDLRFSRRAIDDGESPSSKNDWTTYILNERAREFAYEGKRWFDVLRAAKRNKYENMQPLLDMISASAPSSQLQSMLIKAQDTLSHYLPIYYTELQSNSLLTQNPFYK